MILAKIHVIILALIRAILALIRAILALIRAILALILVKVMLPIDYTTE
jgi:uncharacterized membrane protein YgaE (UPF0421/DUF939 family)